MDKDFEEVLREKIKSIRKNNYVDSGNHLLQEIEDDMTLEEVIAAKERGENLKLYFKAIHNNRLTATYRGFSVVCLPEDFNEEKDIKYGLSHKYEAKILKIDEKKKEVYVSCKEGYKKYLEKKKTFSEKLNNEIKDKLKRKETVVYPAKIVAINARRPGGQPFSFALVSILDSEVTGFILARDFSRCWIHDLSNVCKIGDWIDVEITGKRNSQHSTYNKYWNCSRLNLTESPWTKENIDDRFSCGDILIVKHVLTDQSGNWWWGACDEVKGIQLFCDFRKGVNIHPKGVYKCVVKQVNSAQKIFKVIPLKEMNPKKD